jgi:hypothetical protein
LKAQEAREKCGSAEKARERVGGYRVITFFTGTDIPVFLLNIFAKNEKTNLTPAERNVLKSVLAGIVSSYTFARE